MSRATLANHRPLCHLVTLSHTLPLPRVSRIIWIAPCTLNKTEQIQTDGPTSLRWNVYLPKVFDSVWSGTASVSIKHVDNLVTFLVNRLSLFHVKLWLKIEKFSIKFCFQFLRFELQHFQRLDATLNTVRRIWRWKRIFSKSLLYVSLIFSSLVLVLSER